MECNVKAKAGYKQVFSIHACFLFLLLIKYSCDKVTWDNIFCDLKLSTLSKMVSKRAMLLH